MGVKFSNNAYGTLNGSITTSDTSLTLASGQGARFPTLGAGDYFYATLLDTSHNLEIVKATARTGDVLTVVRAQENTLAKAYAIGDRLELRVTAGGITDAVLEATLSNDPAPTLTADLNLNGSDITGTGNIDVTGSVAASSVVDVGTDLYMRNGDILFDANQTGIHWLQQNSIASPGNGADVSMIVDGEDLIIYEPEQISFGANEKEFAGGRTGSGKLWARFKDDGGLLMYTGWAANYDSGWISVSTSGSGNQYALSHNLGTKDLFCLGFFRPSSTSTYFACSPFHTMQNTSNGGTASDWAGYGVEHPTTNTSYLYVGNNYIFITDNTQTYGGSQTNNRWTSGQVRVLLFRVGVGGE